MTARLGLSLVRDVALLLLRDRVPAVQGRVHRGRAWPTDPAAGPCLLLYAFDTRFRPRGTAGGMVDFQAAGTLAIHARASGPDPLAVEEEAQLLAEAAMSALLDELDSADPDVSRPSLLSLVDAIERVDEAAIQAAVKQAGEVFVGEAVLTLRLLWDRAYPPRAADLLEEMRVEIDKLDAGGPDGAIELAASFLFPSDPAP